MTEFLTLLFLLAAMYAVFRISVASIKKLVELPARKSVITGEVNAESSKMTLTILDWFTWNIVVNNEKGTAGGNIKVNFPIKSSLALSAICLAIAWTAHSLGISLVVSLVFISFAIYHFNKWRKTIHIIKSGAAFPQIKELYRAQTNRILAGVCQGIYLRFHVPVWIVRFVFVFLTIYYGLGIILYGLFWMFVPIENGTPTA